MGFVDGHLVGTYAVFNAKTQTINLTKDVTLLSYSFDEWNKVEKPTIIPLSCKGYNDEKLK